MITNAAMAAPATASSSATVAIIYTVVEARATWVPVVSWGALTTKRERRLKIMRSMRGRRYESQC